MKEILYTTIIATALIAGALAFLPVEEAQAVHTTVQSTQFTEAGAPSAEQNCVLDAGDGCTVSSTTSFLMYCIIDEGGIGAGTQTFTESLVGSEANTFDFAGAESGYQVTWAGEPGQQIAITGSAAHPALCTAITTSGGTITFG